VKESDIRGGKTVVVVLVRHHLSGGINDGVTVCIPPCKSQVNASCVTLLAVNHHKLLVVCPDGGGNNWDVLRKFATRLQRDVDVGIFLKFSLHFIVVIFNGQIRMLTEHDAHTNTSFCSPLQLQEYLGVIVFLIWALQVHVFQRPSTYQDLTLGFGDSFEDLFEIVFSVNNSASSSIFGASKIIVYI
jgi:hypothetical protein